MKYLKRSICVIIVFILAPFTKNGRKHLKDIYSKHCISFIKGSYMEDFEPVIKLFKYEK